LNDDGLAAEERQRLKDEKESAKIKRQVEADLGGFDIEQEWVEEIEREDCFKVEKDFGGAPPIPKRVYSVWVVDAATGWNVVDSHELGEFEHATTMQVMTLTEVSILFFVIFEDSWSNLIIIFRYNAVYGRAGKL
jgi:cleavage and polyadenylation specificity factor subunit 1